jgi:hypothetical protein
VFLAGLISACSASIKTQAVKGTQAAHAAVGSAQDTEIRLWASSEIPNYLEADRRAFHGALVKYFDAEAKVILALQTWRAGDPPPADLSAGLKALDEAIALLRKVGPAALAPVLTYIESGSAALQGVLTLTKGR